MTKNRRSQISQIFGDRAFAGGLFYQYSHSLRIELSGDRPNIRMFLRAYERSKSILDFALGDLETIGICLSFYGAKSLLGDLSVFRNLRRCGITIPKTAEIWQCEEKQNDDDDWDLMRTFICFDRCYRDLDLCLWGVLANELGIRPRSICSLYIFSIDRQILFHPYDDRGMDIIGNNHQLLGEIYARFNEWLLDDDRSTMDRYFSNHS